MKIPLRYVAIWDARIIATHVQLLLSLSDAVSNERFHGVASHNALRLTLLGASHTGGDLRVLRADAIDDSRFQSVAPQPLGSCVGSTVCDEVFVRGRRSHCGAGRRHALTRRRIVSLRHCGPANECSDEKTR